VSIPLPQLPGHDLLTNSRQSCFKRCPREQFHRYEQGVRPASDTPPLRIGSAIHDAIDMRAKGADREAIEQAIDARYAMQPTRTAEDAVELDIERVIVHALFDGYCKAWKDDFNTYRYDPGTTDMAYLHPLTPIECIASELSFELPLRNPETNRKHPKFKRAGKIDRIVKLADGRTAIKETKTTGDSIDSSSDYWSVLAIDPQISGYLIAAQELDYPAETILYDVLHKPGMRPLNIPILDENGIKIVIGPNGDRVYNKDGKTFRQSPDAALGYVLQTRPETPEEFDVRLRADIASRPEFYYARREIPRLSNDLDEYRAELWQVAAALAEAQKKGRWYRNTGSCRSMRRCEYLPICHHGLDPNSPPPGFVTIGDLHPELGAVL